MRSPLGRATFLFAVLMVALAVGLMLGWVTLAAIVGIIWGGVAVVVARGRRRPVPEPPKCVSIQAAVIGRELLEAKVDPDWIRTYVEEPLGLKLDPLRPIKPGLPADGTVDWTEIRDTDGRVLRTDWTLHTSEELTLEEAQRRVDMAYPPTWQYARRQRGMRKPGQEPEEKWWTMVDGKWTDK